MIIAHISDLHLLALDGAVPFRLLNKRLTGYLNLRFRRAAVHKAAAVRAAAREIRRLQVDHVVITGDVTNLALEQEFELVRRLLDDDLAMPTDRVSIVPGNHDVYTGGSFRSERFCKYFAPYLHSDLPEARVAGALPGFPFVKLRGPAAIIGLSTALPRPPLFASGVLGSAQLDALSGILAHPEVARRTPIILQHHPIHNPKRRVKRLMDGLVDAAAEMTTLAPIEQGLLLHGHLHRRIHRKVKTERGSLASVGATSASLIHESDEKMGGFNIYEIAPERGRCTISSYRLVLATNNFREVSVPESSA